jgi:hypothetical protein
LVAKDMLRTSRHIKIGLLVDSSGAILGINNDIRLGDIVGRNTVANTLVLYTYIWQDTPGDPWVDFRAHTMVEQASKKLVYPKGPVS